MSGWAHDAAEARADEVTDANWARRLNDGDGRALSNALEAAESDMVVWKKEIFGYGTWLNKQEDD